MWGGGGGGKEGSDQDLNLCWMLMCVYCTCAYAKITRISCAGLYVLSLYILYIRTIVNSNYD